MVHVQRWSRDEKHTMVHVQHVFEQEPGYIDAGDKSKASLPVSLLFCAEVEEACVALPEGFALPLVAAGGSAAAAAAAAACCKMTLDPPSATFGKAGRSSGLAALCSNSHSLICTTYDDITPPALCYQMPDAPSHEIHMIIKNGLAASTA